MIFTARMLGFWLPLRVLYELFARSGLLGRFLRRELKTIDKLELSSPLFESNDIPSFARERALEEADRVCDGSISLFGRSLQISDPPDWSAGSAGSSSWPNIPWWEIDIYSDEARDVKWAWELARHRHLVILARAAEAADGNPRYVSTLNSHLRSWFESNPLEIGVHWYSNLEIALRALAWAQILSVAGAHLDQDVEDELVRHLYQSGRHITAVLPLTISSMRNNHLIGDAVGLVAIGKTFQSDPQGRRWAAIGDKLLRWHLPEHVHPDGSSIEDSLGYRCFVLELLTIRMLLGDAPNEVTDAASRLAQHLAREGVAICEVPRFGDWDSGHVIVGDVADQRPMRTLETFLAAAGTGATQSSRERSASLPWYVSEGQPKPSEAAVTAGSDTGGNLGRLSRDPWTIWLKCGAEPSHGHSDLLSVAIQYSNQWVIGDPGNGSYNRSLKERNYYRTSIAHSVVRLDDIDQRVPHRRFRWVYNPDGDLGPPFDAGSYRVMWGRHFAYRRLEPPRDCLRACLVSATAVIVVDWVLGPSGAYALSLPLHPDVTWTGSELIMPNGEAIGLILGGLATVTHGSTTPFDGWWADTYDSVRAATRLQLEGNTDGPIAWALWTGLAPQISTQGQTLVVDGWSLEPTVTNMGPTLTASQQ